MRAKYGLVSGESEIGEMREALAYCIAFAIVMLVLGGIVPGFKEENWMMVGVSTVLILLCVAVGFIGYWLETQRLVQLHRIDTAEKFARSIKEDTDVKAS